MSKQNFYKTRRARRRREVDEGLVLDLVRAERSAQPMLGGRKLLVRIEAELAEAGVSIGRDRLLALLRREGLLVPRRRRHGARTTDSRHRFRVYPNLLKNASICGPNQAWAADLTYIRTEEGFAYLALVMDVHSRLIVGWHLGENLEASGCLAALAMARRQLPAGEAPMHHSDRGTQYCCTAYTQLLGEARMAISMTEENHCYENGKAERLNGILKQEYGLGATLRSVKEARRVAAQAVELYNTCRPHAALGYRTPASVHGLEAVA